MTWMMNLARFVPGGLFGVAAVAGVAHFVVDKPSEDDHHMTAEPAPGVEPHGDRIFWGWIVGLNDGQPVQDARVCVVRDRPDLLCADADGAGYWELIGRRRDFVAPGNRYAVLSFEADGYRPTIVSRSVWAQNPEIVVGLFPYGQFQQIGQEHGGSTGVDTGSILLVATEAPKGLGIDEAMPPPRIEPPPIDDPQFLVQPGQHGDGHGHKHGGKLDVPTVPYPKPQPPPHEGTLEDLPSFAKPQPPLHEGTFEDAPRPDAPTVRPEPGVAQHVPSFAKPIAKPAPDGRPHGTAGDLPTPMSTKPAPGVADEFPGAEPADKPRPGVADELPGDPVAAKPSPGTAGEYPADEPTDKPAPGVSDELPGDEVRPEPGTAAHVPSFAKPIAKPGHDGLPTGTADLLPGEPAKRPNATTVDWGDVVVDVQPGTVEAVFGDNPLPPNAAEAYPAVPKTMWFGVQVGEVAVDLSSLVAEGCVPVHGWGFEDNSSAPTMVMPGSVTWVEVVCGQ